jgi:hypothetical protein
MMVMTIISLYAQQAVAAMISAVARSAPRENHPK